VKGSCHRTHGFTYITSSKAPTWSLLGRASGGAYLTSRQPPSTPDASVASSRTVHGILHHQDGNSNECRAFLAWLGSSEHHQPRVRNPEFATARADASTALPPNPSERDWWDALALRINRCEARCRAHTHMHAHKRTRAHFRESQPPSTDFEYPSGALEVGPWRRADAR
jgi:hypothetical protein